MKTIRLMFVIMLAVIAIGLKGTAQEQKGEVFFKVDTMPEYPGGNKALMKDITDMVKYPEEALKQGLTGRIYVSFEVNKEGKIYNTYIARGVDPLLDKEALQVINRLNKIWKPGIKNGKTVNVSFTVLFDFKEDKKIDISLNLSH